MNTLLERDAPLDALLALFAEVEGGTGACALVGGDAGIGKSSLVDALVARVEAHAEILPGRCDAMLVPRPLGPLADVAEALGPGVVARLEKGAGPVDIFTAVRSALAARSRPVVLVIEDAHWADESTRDLIRFLARRIARLPVLLVITYRADERPHSDPLRLLLGDLVGPRVVRIDLEPLSAAAVGQLVAATAHRQTGGRGVHRLDEDGALHALTGGNPFFVREILTERTGRLPATVRDVIIARLIRLDPEVQTLVRIVSLVPQRCERRLLVDGFAREFAAVATQRSEDVTSGLLIQAGESLAFRHELARRAVAESVAESMPLAAADWHRRFVDMLARRDVPPLARLAHHASAAGDRSLIVRWALAAGAEARRMGSRREAAELFGAVIAASGEHDGTDLDLVTLYENHADACQAILALDLAIDSRRKAIALCDADGAHLRAGDNLRWLGRLHWLEGHRVEAMAAYQQALDRLEPLGATRELAWAYAFKAGSHMTAEEDEAAIEYATLGLALADTLGALDVRAHALNTLGDSQQYRDVDWRARLEESLRLSLAEGFVDHAARAYINLASTAVVAQDFAYARLRLDEGIRYAVDRDLDYQRDYLRAWSARERFECDDWRAAEALANGLVDNPRTAPVARIPAMGTLAAIAVRSGAIDAERLLVRAEAESARTGEHQRLAPLIDARAELAWSHGDDRTAAAHARAGAAAALAHGSLDNLGRFALWLWRCGARDEAREFLDREPRCPARFADVIHGRWDQAATAWAALGCHYQEALTLCDGPPHAIRRALALLDALGATPAVRSLRGRHPLRGALPGPRPSTRRDSLGLTPSERRVLQFVALGWSNAAIADRLFRSERTIEHHVSKLLAKLGVDSRGQAVDLIRRMPDDPPAGINSGTDPF